MTLEAVSPTMQSPNKLVDLCLECMAGAQNDVLHNNIVDAGRLAGRLVWEAGKHVAKVQKEGTKYVS